MNTDGLLEYMNTHGRVAINNLHNEMMKMAQVRSIDNLIQKCTHKWIPLNITPVVGNIYLRTCALCGCQGLSVVRDD